ncbi:MAG: sulfatase-like hydrolase/transferase [Burkholderiaceae bacterium]|nr:sulfatase-like hydrolase/transferase [Burkholderiaceae bacterium]
MKSTKLPFRLYIWNAIFIAITIVCISGRYLTEHDSWDFWQLFYFCVFGLSNFFFLNLIVALLTAYPLGRFNLAKIATFLTITFSSLLTVFILADTFVYQQYRLHINLAMLEMTLLGGGEVVQFSQSMLIQIVVICLAILVWSILSFSLARLISQKLIKTTYFLVFLISVLFIGANVLYAYAYPINWTNVLVIKEKLPLIRPLKMNSFFIKTGIIKESDIQSSNLSIDNKVGNFKYPLNDLNCGTRVKDLNIVFIFVDALRSDVVTKENAPNVWNFAEKNIVFKNHYAVGNHTRDSLFSTFYGIPSTYWFSALADKVPSAFVTALQKSNYNIGVFAGAPLTRPEFHQTIFSSVQNLRLNSPGDTILERDRHAIDDFISWHQKKDNKTENPFFSFIFLDNVHGYAFPEDQKHTFYQPYWKEINHIELNSKFDPAPYFNRYKNAVHYADEQIARILQYIESQNLMDSTIVVISSDHGEEFNDHGLNYWGHGGNYTDVQIKVPLIIHWPGKAKAKIQYMTNHYDITATFLPEVFNCHNPVSDYSIGHSLWSTKNRRDWFIATGYSDKAIVENDRVVLINKMGALEYLDKQLKQSPNQSMPPHLKDALLDMSRYRR